MTCSCGRARAEDRRGFLVCAHCDQPCATEHRYCSACRALSLSRGRGPRVQ